MIKREILCISTSLHSVSAVYGFGSFFRGATYDDIDLIVVLSCDWRDILLVSTPLRTAIHKLGERLGVKFDLTVLTLPEFAERPIRDMNELALIYSALDRLDDDEFRKRFRGAP